MAEHVEDLRSATHAGRRERPILELGPVGPWQARVRVVPIAGAGLQQLRRVGFLRKRWVQGRYTEQALFDVVATWTGPPLPELPPSSQPVDALDTYVVEDQELAQSVARAAADLLGAGEIPFLRDLADAFLAVGTDSWAGWYRRKVGDAGRAAAER